MYLANKKSSPCGLQKICFGHRLELDFEGYIGWFPWKPADVVCRKSVLDIGWFFDGRLCHSFLGPSMLLAAWVIFNGDADTKHCFWSVQLLLNFCVCKHIELCYCLAGVLLTLSVCKMLFMFGVILNGVAGQKHCHWSVQLLLNFCVCVKTLNCAII